MKPHLQTTVFTLLAAGKSQREVERITRIDRKTIRGLARRFATEQSNSPGVATGSVSQIPPPRPPGPGRQSTSACEPHRVFIQAQLLLRRNFTAVYQDLVDQFGFTASYNSVKRFASSLIEHEPAQFDRLEFAPGEEVQVDYGEGALTLFPGTDRYSPCHCKDSSTSSNRNVPSTTTPVCGSITAAMPPVRRSSVAAKPWKSAPRAGPCRPAPDVPGQPWRYSSCGCWQGPGPALPAQYR